MKDIDIPDGFEVPGWDAWADGKRPQEDAPLLYGPAFVELPVNEHGRDFFVGDLHGHFNKLWRLLDAVGFGRGDRVITAGDLIDRGPHSAELLEIVNFKSFLYATIGNHEEELIQLDPKDVPPYYRMQVGIEKRWWVELPAVLRSRYRRIARTMPVAIEVPLQNGMRVGVIHAQVPQQDWACARVLAPTYGDCRGPSRNDTFVALHARSIAHGIIRDQRQRPFPSQVHHIDLVVTGHSCVVPGEVWRYGNQIGLESLAYSRHGAMTLFDPLQGRYWKLANPHSRSDGVWPTVQEIEPPVDFLQSPY